MPTAFKHPAKFSDNILEILKPYCCGKVLDPFAGVGKLRIVCPEAYLLELEPEWAEMCGAVQGTVLDLPWDNEYFDAIITSPPYGNRMADSLRNNKWTYNTYTNAIGRNLTEGSGASMQWGKKYRAFHVEAWKECDRVLKPGGTFVLNISNHIRNGREALVTEFHNEVFVNVLGYTQIEHHKIDTKRLKQGSNSELRVAFESVLVYTKIK